jgi:hypothetical protein
MPGLRYHVSWTATLAVALLVCLSAAARAQIRVEGRADAVRMEVVDATLGDVLGALQARFGLRYRSNGALDAVRTAKLHAPLRRVVARLLEGYDFVITVTPAGIDVLILQQSAVASVVIPRAGSPPVPAPPAPVVSSAEASRRERD